VHCLISGEVEPVDGESAESLLAVWVDSLEIELIDAVGQIDLQGKVAIRISDKRRPAQLQIERSAPSEDERAGSRVPQNCGVLAVCDPGA
jgi:hypothetical protein